MSEPSLEELFARLKAPQNSSSPSHESTQYQAPAVSSPIFSPPARATPPVHSSDILSPAVGSPAPDQRTNNLLNLLKFNGSVPQPPTQPAPQTGTHPQSVVNLVGSFPRAASGSIGASSSASAVRVTSPPASSTQTNYLLDLLNRPKASSMSSGRNDGNPLPGGARPSDTVDKLVQSFANTTVQAPQPKASLFGHVNAFDQLHASSPLNRSPRPDGQSTPKKIEILKHSREGSSSSAAKDAPSNNNQSTTTQSPPPAEEPRQSVSEALGDVAEQVDKQVERALAKAGVADKVVGDVPAPVAAQTSAEGDGNITKKAAGADNDVESSWESAEDEEQEGEIPVYNFPMKPFVCIQINPSESQRPIRQDNFMVIAQLKKEFDQVDRCLVTATQSYIGYAQLANKKDNAGLRVIRQDTGHHKQVFRSSGERVFNVQFCESTTDIETVLGTGVSGSIFWASLAKSRSDLFLDDDVEAQGFYMPAVATPEEQTSGSPVKTRAKMSSRHPEFLAISRGKHIHLIVPETVKDKSYCDTNTRKVDSEKYLNEHGLRIMTGKAGKDFCFSEDDSVIVSLDKSGRLKFWDIRELTRRALDYSEGRHDPVELTEPVWTFTAAASDTKPDEKPSVSSIMFIDKEKPTTKGTALRYLIIGFKQNHILQLFDLALKKPVQEVRLPHEKDSDGFCSITYHPRTGIIAVGHPTRNSIYLIHLSAPKYNLGVMEQAKFITYLARDEPNGLPKPDSTAIMSGVREFSFSKVGQLRSLEMLRDPVEEAQTGDGEDETQFELYIMHSKGVTGVSIKRKDLGWTKNGTVLRPIDAVESGFVTVKPMDSPQNHAPSDAASSSETTSQQQTPVKKADTAKPTKAETKKEAQAAATPRSNGASKSASPTKSGAGSEASNVSSSQAPDPPMVAPESYAMAAQRGKPNARDKDALATPHKGGRSAEPAGATTASRGIANDDFERTLSNRFDSLYKRIDDDRRVQDAAGAAKQDAVLRLVSSTLTENVEKSLTRIVSSSIEKEIVPHLNKSTAKAIEKKLAETMPQQLNNVIAKEVKAVLPNAIQQALKDPQVHRAITDNVAAKMQQQVSNLLQQSMPNIATQATQKIISDWESRTNAQLREAENRRQQDNAKILELSSLVRALSETIQTMSENQAAFQEQMVKLQHLSGVEPAQGGSPSTTAVAAASSRGEEDEEVRKITQLLVDGQYETATVDWLQSVRQAELFDKIFIRVNPQYLSHVSPLVALSVSAAITATFSSNVDRRLDWLATVLTGLDLQDPEIRDVAPKIMDVLSSRLQAAYMRIAEENPNDPILRRVSTLNRQVVEVRRLAG